MPLKHTSIGTVSVVITTYNRPDYLLQALQSVLAQTYPITQIIIIDDCSPTPPHLVLDQFDDPRIIYERLAINSGANAARNRGIDLANSDWLAFLDDDDVWLPEKLTAQFESMEVSDGDLDWLGAVCSYRFMDSGIDRQWGSTGEVDLNVLKTGNPYCGTSGLIVKRSIVNELKFDQNLPCGQDWDMFIRLSLVGSLLYVQKPLLLYRRGSHDSVTVKAKKLEIANLPPRLAAAYKHRNWMGDIAFKQRIAKQTLAYVWHKRHPLKWIRESIRLAGWSATCSALWSKLSNRINARSRTQKSEALGSNVNSEASN